jgi:anaerobic carbon-monoxide dehydrogenase catalytic subunit
METIHFKTVDPVSQDLLRGASQKGLGLNWERYEKQQPQDGFLRLGLSCPYGCMQGPCRIDPYGRGADRGICGLDRDSMAAAFLLRLALQGVLETMQAYQVTPQTAAIAWQAPLAKRAAAALAETGGAPLSTWEVLESAVMLARPSATPEVLVRQAIRLGLISVGLVKKDRAQGAPGSLRLRAGYGVLAGEGIMIGITGQIPDAQVQALLKKTAGRNKPEARLVSLGDWIPAGDGFVPIVCTSGEAETALSSGRLSVLLAGPRTDPGLLALAGTMKIPILFSADNPSAAAVLKEGRAAFDRRVPSSFSPDPALIGEGRVSIGAREVGAVLRGGSAKKIALIGGADTLFQSFGHLPVELATALRGEGHAVASWGDAAVWMVKQGLAVGILDDREGPLAAVKSLAAAGKMADLKGICFTGLKNSRDFTFALGLAALGTKVSVAVPLPLWGSETVRTVLRKSLAAAGGILAHFDHPAKGDEILNWMLRA